MVSAAELSCDPVYRGLVRASRDNPELLEVVSDYREEHGSTRLRPKLARKEKKLPASWYPPLSPEQERAQKAEDKRRALAVAVAEVYHSRVARLYQSKRAGVVYGRGGIQQVDWDAYGKRGYHNPHTGRKQPAKWQDAGVRIVGEGRKARIVLENHRGTEVARLPMPPRGANLAAWIVEVTS